MNLSEFDLINEAFFAESVTALQLDFLLAEGWRHFGKHFYRYNVGLYQNEFRHVHPLRIKINEFSPSKSKKRIRRRNSDLAFAVRPATIDVIKMQLFERHASRFKSSVPNSIYTFLDKNPATTPCETYEICVFAEEKLAAVSFFDIGATAISSIYAMFEPEMSKRSLGILTILLEIEFGLQLGKTHYYLGYSYEGESFYDYKKGFAATETYDWKGEWA